MPLADAMVVYSYGLYSYGLYSYGLYSYGLSSYGQYRHCLCSYGLYRHALHSYGHYRHCLCSYDLYSYGLSSYGLYGSHSATVAPQSTMTCLAEHGMAITTYRHRRRHVRRAGMGVPVLKMTASPPPIPAQWTCRRQWLDRVLCLFVLGDRGSTVDD